MALKEGLIESNLTGWPRLTWEQSQADVKTMLGMSSWHWGGDAGSIWELYKVEPCCGKPFNPKDAILCCVQFYCMGPCTFSKLFAYSVDQPWSLYPHFLMTCCCPHCTMCVLRYNLRHKYGVKGSFSGDYCNLCYMPCCSVMQEIRSVPQEAWSHFPNFVAPAVSAPEVKIFR